MPLYNLLEYSRNYSKTTVFFWNFYRDELTDETNDADSLNKNVINSKSFKYKRNITGNTSNIAVSIIGDGGNLVPNPDYDANKNGKEEVEIVLPLRHLGNFWTSLNIPLVNCEVSLILT